MSTWQEVERLVLILTLCGILWNLGSVIYRTLSAVLDFFIRLEAHIVHVERKLDENLEWFKAIISDGNTTRT